MSDPKQYEPEPGTYAFTAIHMAKMFPDFDWDAWKDEMKEQAFHEQDEEQS